MSNQVKGDSGLKEAAVVELVKGVGMEKLMGKVESPEYTVSGQSG